MNLKIIDWIKQYKKEEKKKEFFKNYREECRRSRERMDKNCPLGKVEKINN